MFLYLKSIWIYFQNVFSVFFLLYFPSKKRCSPCTRYSMKDPAKEVSLLQKGCWGVCSCKNLTQEGSTARSLWIRLQTWGFWECAYKVKVKCHRIKCWHSTASSVPLAATSSMVRELGGGKVFPDVAANHHLLVCSVTPSEKTTCKHEWGHS